VVIKISIWVERLFPAWIRDKAQESKIPNSPHLILLTQYVQPKCEAATAAAAAAAAMDPSST
jgi:hypothetical protein